MIEHLILGPLEPDCYQTCVRSIVAQIATNGILVTTIYAGGMRCEPLVAHLRAHLAEIGPRSARDHHLGVISARRACIFRLIPSNGDISSTHRSCLSSPSVTPSTSESDIGSEPGPCACSSDPYAAC